MSYLFIVVIGAVVGFIGGKYLKGSELGVLPDIGAGAIGAGVLVLIVRMVGPAAASGFVMSSIVAILGGIALLYAMRTYMKSKEVPVARKRRR